MYAESFGAKLKHARERTGFTQREVATETGINQSLLARYETGKLEPSIETLGTLADFYGVSCDWLIGTAGENPLYRPNKNRDIITDKIIGAKKRG